MRNRPAEADHRPAFRPDPRPEMLPLFVAFFIIGLQAGAARAGAWHLFFGALTLGGLGLSFLVRLRGLVAWLPLVLAAIGVGGLNGTLRAERVVPPETFAAFDGTEGVLEGMFIGEFRLLNSGGLSFLIEGGRFEVASQTVDLPGRLRWRVRSHELLPEPGQWYRGEGTFRSTSGRTFPQFDSPEIRTISHALAPGRLVGGVQRSLRDRIATLLPERHQALLLAFLLGDTSSLDQKDRKLFQRTGVSHLMAVSGQHIIVLVFFLAAVLTWLRVPPLSRGLVVLGLLIAYGFVTVGNPSVWRAIVMYLVAVAVVHLEADPGPIRPLSLAALLLLLVNPPWLSHIGFQLSFVAILGIVFGRLPIEQRLCAWKVPPILSRYLAISLAANVATLPLVGYHYGSVSLASFVANPLLVWTFSVILPVGMLLPSLGWAWEPLGVIAASGLSLFLDLFLATLELCGTLPFATVTVGGVPGMAVALIYAALLALVSPTGFFRLDWGEDAPGLADEAALPKISQPVLPSGSRSPSRPPVSPRTESSAGEPPLSLPVNPLAIPELLEAVDQQMAVFPKRSLKGRGQFETIIFPVQKLSLEGQTLYHRLDDLTREVLKSEPDRLLQAQVFLMALLGTELLARVVPSLEPPPTPADIPVAARVRNRYLAMALIADGFFLSPLPGRAGSETLARTIGEAQKLHLEARRRLYKFIKSRDPEDIEDYLAGRVRVLAWLKDSSGLAPEPDVRKIRPDAGNKRGTEE